jgi:hypothetical protein
MTERDTKGDGKTEEVVDFVFFFSEQLLQYNQHDTSLLPLKFLT